MYEHGVQLKATKCKWFANAAAWQELEASSYSMRIDIDAQFGVKVGYASPMAHIGVPFALEPYLDILGARLTPDAGSEVAILFALSRGRRHWIQRRKQLCRRRVPLSKRILRYYATVGATVLHGLEGAPLTQLLLRKVQSLDRRNLHCMACLRKRPDETWIVFKRQQNRLLRTCMGEIGVMELAAKLLSKQHGWAGHVSRQPAYHISAAWSRVGTLEEWHLKQTVYSQLDPLNAAKWRHKAKGPKIHWETSLAAVYGDLWRNCAMDRKAWRKSRCHFLSVSSDALLGQDARLFGVSECAELEWKPSLTTQQQGTVDNETLNVSFGNLFVERGVAQAALKILSSGVQTQFIGDSSVQVDCLLGRASTKEPGLQRSVRLGHTALKTLIQCFNVQSPDAEDLAKQVPRADNSAADAAANWALDHESFTDIRLQAAKDFLIQLSSGGHPLGLVFSFDGAARGNPGPSSAGVCAWWGRFHMGEFLSEGLLLQKGTCLGTGTNNGAEAFGALRRHRCCASVPSACSRDCSP